MKRTLISDITNNLGKTVKVAGWVQNKRDHGKMVFIDLGDRSGILQVVGKGNLSVLKPEDVVEITGLVKNRPQKDVNDKIATGRIELEAQDLNVLSKAEELPFDMAADNLNVELPTLLDWRALSLRHPKVKAIFKVQETIIQGFREVLKQDGFTEIQAPTIVPTATEGGAEIFKIKYYDKDAFLAQSPQLYKQIMVGVFERVFTLAHAYRAEPSVTTRHLSEYLSLDVEMGFVESFQEIMEEVERVVRYIFQKLNKERIVELKLFSATTPPLPVKIPQLKMREAQQIIFERTGRDNREEPDLEPEDEKEICRYALGKYGSELIFITHYPTKKRPFYTFPDPQDPEYTCSFDLLGRGLEWVTGGQRINDYQQLLENVKKRGNKPADFELYLQAFRFGMPPEGGFAIGAERVTMQILGLNNLREASLFPRDMERIDQRLSAIKSKKKPKKR